MSLFVYCSRCRHERRYHKDGKCVAGCDCTQWTAEIID